MDAPQDVGREAWRLLFQLFRTQRKEMAKMHSEFQFNPAQVHLLMSLENGPAPMSELAEALHCDASYITGLVDKLEDRGLVQRSPNPADRRVKLIVPTPEGLEMCKRLMDRFSEPPPFIASLSHADKSALRDIFLKATQSAAAPPTAKLDG
jgi:DNA-binding MarR family transcriptional regulator